MKLNFANLIFADGPYCEKRENFMTTKMSRYVATVHDCMWTSLGPPPSKSIIVILEQYRIAGNFQGVAKFRYFQGPVSKQEIKNS